MTITAEDILATTANLSRLRREIRNEKTAERAKRLDDYVESANDPKDPEQRAAERSLIYSDDLG
jgi:hypothetical protein